MWMDLRILRRKLRLTEGGSGEEERRKEEEVTVDEFGHFGRRSLSVVIFFFGGGWREGLGKRGRAMATATARPKTIPVYIGI